MKHTVRKAFTAITLTAAMLATASTAAFAAEDTATADEAVNPGNYTYTITDATNVQKAIAQISELTDEQEFLYDIDGSEGITISDATTIQKIVAKICGQPTYHEETSTVVEHPAEYEEVKVVDQEATTEETPVYIWTSRDICKECGEDISQLFGRYDDAIERGLIVEGDSNFEKLTEVNGHYYKFVDEKLEYLALAKGEYGYYNGLWITAEEDIWVGIGDDSDTHSCYYDGGQWRSETGWYKVTGLPSSAVLEELSETTGMSTTELTIGYMLTQSAEESQLTDEELNLINETWYTMDGKNNELRYEEVEWTNQYGNECETPIIYKTVTTPEKSHTEKVLVKDAWTETVHKNAGWYCD